MKHLTRIRIAALSAAFFLGGLTAAGFGIRATHDPNSTPLSPVRPRTQVIHQTRIRTVHLRAKRKQQAYSPPPRQVAQPTVAPQQVAAAPTTVTRPPVAQQPTKVKSRVSPTGGGRSGDDAGEHEGRDD